MLTSASVSALLLFESLTPRERQVCEIIVRGKTTKHAARELGIAERTIKAHRQLIMGDEGSIARITRL